MLKVSSASFVLDKKYAGFPIVQCGPIVLPLPHQITPKPQDRRYSKKMKILASSGDTRSWFMFLFKRLAKKEKIPQKKAIPDTLNKKTKEIRTKDNSRLLSPKTLNGYKSHNQKKI